MFVVPASKRDGDDGRYRFKIGDDEFSMPAFKYITVRAHAIMRESVFEGLVEAADTAKAKAAIGRLDIQQADELAADWIKASRVTPGESQASSDS